MYHVNRTMFVNEIALSKYVKNPAKNCIAVAWRLNDPQNPIG
jgi:hypothetical protein